MRRGLSTVLVIFATFFAFLAIFALWANRQLLDTDNWTDTSGALLEDDAIREQLSIFLIDELYSNVDVQARIEEALPPRADALAAPAASGLRGPLEDAADELLQRPRAQDAWEQANRVAHETFLRVVEDKGEAVSTTGGDVTLDLKQFLELTEQRVGVGGRLAEKIPEDAAQLTIMKSDELELAQDVLDLMKALAIVLVVLAFGLFGLSVFLAKGRRRQALRACGIGFILAGVGALVARGIAGGAVVDALVDAESVRPAVQNTWDISTTLLVEAAGATILYGVFIVVAAWLAGPTALAVSTRRALAPYLREPRYAYGLYALFALLLIAWGPTPALRKPLTALILLALLAFGVEALRRLTAREHPDASIEDASQRMHERLSSIRERVSGGGRRAGSDDQLDQLERLAKLREAGAIDQAEFDREKARLLGSAPAASGS